MSKFQLEFNRCQTNHQVPGHTLMNLKIWTIDSIHLIFFVEMTRCVQRDSESMWGQFLPPGYWINRNDNNYWNIFSIMKFCASKYFNNSSLPASELDELTEKVALNRDKQRAEKCYYPLTPRFPSFPLSIGSEYRVFFLLRRNKKKRYAKFARGL